jgi:cell wall-associated NlpC family hydrolase
MIKSLFFILILLFQGCSSNLTQRGIIPVAKSKLGAPYRYGKAGENSFDCSGFVYYVYKRNGILIPRTSKAQSKMRGQKIFNKYLLKPGDILFFDTADRGYVNHSGIYLGDMRFIHASSGKAHSVTISRLDRGFYKNRFLWAIRVK